MTSGIELNREAAKDAKRVAGVMGPSLSCEGAPLLGQGGRSLYLSMSRDGQAM